MAAGEAPMTDKPLQVAADRGSACVEEVGGGVHPTQDKAQGTVGLASARDMSVENSCMAKQGPCRAFQYVTQSTSWSAPMCSPCPWSQPAHLKAADSCWPPRVLPCPSSSTCSFCGVFAPLSLAVSCAPSNLRSLLLLLVLAAAVLML